jgi:uncharacterized membrane protein (DUF106 family)
MLLEYQYLYDISSLAALHMMHAIRSDQASISNNIDKYDLFLVFWFPDLLLPNLLEHISFLLYLYILCSFGVYGQILSVLT